MGIRRDVFVGILDFRAVLVRIGVALGAIGLYGAPSITPLNQIAIVLTLDQRTPGACHNDVGTVRIPCLFIQAVRWIQSIHFLK
jgi:hypothetical protein